jgi:FtsH-binding integral membrane protein
MDRKHDRRGGAPAILRLMRASIALSPIADAIAGQALARAAGGAPASGFALAGGWLAPLCLFVFGMVQNDLADRHADAAASRPRPLARGDVSLALARTLLLLAGAAALGFASLAGAQAFAIAAAMLAAISLYNLAPRHLGLGGPLVLGGIRGADLCLGAASLGLAAAAALPALAYVVYVAALSCVARMEDGALAVSRPVIAVATAIAALAAPVGIVIVAGTDPPPLAVATAVGLALWLFLAHRRLPETPAGREIGRFVGAALSGMFLFVAALAFAAGGDFSGLAVVVMFALARALVRAFPPS